MVTPAEQEKETRTPNRQQLDDDAKLLERAKRRGTVTDIIGTMVFEGTDKKEIDDILDEDLVLIEYKPASGKFGEFVVLHLYDSKTKKHLSTITGGQVVVRKVKELTEKKALPCMVTVVKVKDYYDLT